MVRNVYICNRCGKMAFQSVFADVNLLPKHWKRINGNNGEVHTDVHLCEQCSNDLESLFLWQESDRRNNVMEVTGLEFSDEDD